MSIVVPLLGYKPLIGVVHLPPLPGSHQGFNGVERIIDYAVNEARKLENSGFDAVILENYSDNPFTVDHVNDFVLTTITTIAREVAKSTSLIVGISLLRNAALQALAAAYPSGASFIRVNTYCEVRVAPEGVLLPAAAQLESIRQKLDRHIAIFADVNVKHSSSLDNRGLEDILRDCTTRGRMDAIIVSGQATSQPPSPGYVAAVKKLANHKPILLGSGVTMENIRAYWNLVDGFIVGTSIKVENHTKKPIDQEKATRLAKLVKDLRQSSLQQF